MQEQKNVTSDQARRALDAVGTELNSIIASLTSKCANYAIMVTEANAKIEQLQKEVEQLKKNEECPTNK